MYLCRDIDRIVERYIYEKDRVKASCINPDLELKRQVKALSLSTSHKVLHYRLPVVSIIRKKEAYQINWKHFLDRWLITFGTF